MISREQERDRQERRRRRPDGAPGRTIGRRAMVRERRLLPLAEEGERETRPRTRAECATGARPCPFVSCRFHLFLDVNRRGGLKLNFPDREPDELAESCALDVADRGGHPAEALRGVLNLTRQAIQFVERKALARLGVLR